MTPMCARKYHIFGHVQTIEVSFGAMKSLGLDPLQIPHCYLLLLEEVVNG